MIHDHSSTASQRACWVSELLAQEGSYGVVSQMSQRHAVSRQSLYRWKAKGRAALAEALSPVQRPEEESLSLERAVLLLLVEGHASYRGIQACLAGLLGKEVSLGSIAGMVEQAGERARQWLAQHAPQSERVLALDEMYGSQRGQAYLNVVDAQSAAVWASISPVAVDGESWTLVLWELQEQGLRWKTTVSDGGKALGEAVQTVTPSQVLQRDVWHVLHECQKMQGRLDRLVEGLQQQAETVARQAARVAKGERPRGAHPVSDVVAHAALLRQAQYVAGGLRYLSNELCRLLAVVVLACVPEGGIVSSQVRREELDTLVALLEALGEVAPEEVQRPLKALGHHVRLALPHLVLFAQELESVHLIACQQLGAAAVHLIAWAWQRRAILGPDSKRLVADFPLAWQPSVSVLLSAWDQAVRASSVVENWHSILRPFLAVHRTLSSGLLAILAVWHNHRVAPRGLHRGQNPLQRSGMTGLASDWLVALGYPPATSASQIALQHDEALAA